jgi:hypothetical protein
VVARRVGDPRRVVMCLTHRLLPSGVAVTNPLPLSPARAHTHTHPSRPHTRTHTPTHHRHHHHP